MQGPDTPPLVRFEVPGRQRNRVEDNAEEDEKDGGSRS